MLLRKTDTATVIAVMKEYPSEAYNMLSTVDNIEISRQSIRTDLLSSTGIIFFNDKDPIQGNFEQRLKLKLSSFFSDWQLFNSDWRKSSMSIEYSIPVFQARPPVFLNACFALSSKLDKVDLFGNKFMYALTGN
jgi:hypothetical protein